jgi:hypothetical protein
MPRRLTICFLFAILLIPSAHFAWKNRRMPQFAYLHDDGILFTSARSMTASTYRIASLPDQPLQTKFPPLYPLYLSAIWRLNPHFPDNLALATFSSWLLLAVYLALAWVWYQRNQVPEMRTWLLVALLGVNPYLIWFGSILFSDIFFSCLVLCTLLVLTRAGVKMALFAGLLAGCAYLSRTSGIALLIALPGWLLWKREKARAAAFAAAMLPAVIGWSLWTRFHAPHTADLTTMFYTDYVRYLQHTTWADMPVILWKNVDQLLYSMGSMVLPRVYDSPPLKILTQVIAVAMISGTVRMVRRGFGIPYALFALVSAGILLVCNFPSTERYMLPIYPLLLAGLFAEIEHVAQMFRPAFRHKDFSQRAAAGVMASGVVAVFVGALLLQFFMAFVFLQASVDEKEIKLRDQKIAYTWIAANLPPSATILSYDDPLLYLYTGRHGIHQPLDPLWWYREDHASIQKTYQDLPEFCRRRGLDYLYFTTSDLARETGDEDQRAAGRLIRENPELTAVFSAGIGTLYKVGPASQPATQAQAAR